MLKVGDRVTFHGTSWGLLQCTEESITYFKFLQVEPGTNYVGVINVTKEYIMKSAALNYYTPKNQIAPALIPSPFTATDLNLQVLPTVECSHDWRWYDSGWSRFEYCYKCNAERNIAT